MTTTEGSIVAYIGANDDQYKATMREAAATAEELGRTDPTVTVHANTSEAMAKIAAFRAEVAAAKDESDPLNMAGLPMSSIRPDGSIKASDWVAAKMAQRDAQAAADAAALDAGKRIPTSAGTAGGGSSGGGIGFAAALGIGIAATLPLLADLAGAAAAGTGAFMGMGAAGILAVKGIKDEMAQGTAVGQQYQALFAHLGDDLSTLEHTAAVGVLNGVSSAVQSINNEMPALNQEIDWFSQGLGTIAGVVIDGLVTGFRVLNPMFLTAEGYIAGVARQWDQWVHNGGLLQWGTDVQRVFPLVADTIGTLGHVVLTLVGDLAPLGTVLFNVLDGALHVADFLTSTLGPAFGPVTLGVLATWLAFKNFSTIAPILDTVTGGLFALSGAQKAATVTAEGMAAAEAGVEAAAGPAGWVVLAASAAIGVLTGALTLGAQAASGASAAMQDYTSAVQQDNGVVADNTQKVIAANLAASGAVDKAKQLGVSQGELTAAVAQGGTALDGLVTSLKNVVAEHTRNVASGRTVVHSIDDTGQAAQALIGILQDQSSTLQANQKTYQDTQTALGSFTSANERAYYASQATAKAYLDQATKASNLATSVQNMIDAIDGSTTANQNAIHTNAAWQQALAGLAAQVKQNGTSLDQNTAAGSKNADMLATAAQNAHTAADAQYQVDLKTMSAKAATEKYVQTLTDSKKALEDSAQKAGLNAQKVQAIVDAADHIPDVKEMKVLVDTADAERKLGWLTATNRFQITIPVSTVGPLAGAYGFPTTTNKASGGPIYASSGMFVPQGTDTVPAMLTPGEVVIRRKSADYDPQFIRNYNDDPERALAGVRGGQSHGQPVVNVKVTGVQQTDPHVLGAIIGNRTSRALAGVPGVNR